MESKLCVRFGSTTIVPMLHAVCYKCATACRATAIGRIPYRHNNYAKKRSAHLTATKKQSTDVKHFSMHFQQIIFDLKYIRGLDGGGHF